MLDNLSLEEKLEKLEALKKELAVLEREMNKYDVLTRSLRKLFTTVLPLIINLGVIITVTGVLVINFRLATITTYVTYNISLTQYIAAGLAFIAQEAILFIPAVIVFLIGLSSFDVLKRMAWFNKFMTKFFRFGFPLYVLTLVLLLISVVYGLVTFGSTTYSQTSRSIGGGAPSDIQIVFRENSKDLDWGISIDSKTGRSEKVELVLELLDGILIRDKRTQLVVKVSNDAIYGIVADSITATPVATIAPSAVPIQIASPTDTP